MLGVQSDSKAKPKIMVGVFLLEVISSVKLFWFFFFYINFYFFWHTVKNKENTSNLATYSTVQLMDKEFNSSETWQNEIGIKSSFPEILVD